MTRDRTFISGSFGPSNRSSDSAFLSATDDHPLQNRILDRSWNRTLPFSAPGTKYIDLPTCVVPESQLPRGVYPFVLKV